MREKLTETAARRAALHLCDSSTLPSPMKRNPHIPPLDAPARLVKAPRTETETAKRGRPQAIRLQSR